MLKITLVEFIFRAVPEAFIHIFAMCVFVGVKIGKKDYIKTSILLSMMMFIIRALPISYGIHTILIIMGMIALSITLNKLSIIDTIRAAIINVVVQFLAEGINLLFIQVVLKREIEVVIAEPVSKTLYGMPSLLIWIMFIFIYYKFMGKTRKYHGEYREDM